MLSPSTPTLAIPLPPIAIVSTPPPLTRLIGRRRECATLVNLLRTTRLLTLTGAGGCGKTRLALALAASVADRYPDGVALVELAPLTDPTLVPHLVAAALGVQEQRGQAFPDMLESALRPRTTLLVLDNCEHLVEACAALAARLLGACPHLTVLATSRESLRIAGETTWRVPPLTLPNDGGAITPARLLTSEAAQLFVERARARQPEFSVTRENAATVQAICQRLEGMPLALELAAARVGAMPLPTIAARLDDALALLTVGNRAALPRQQTLRTTLEWSHTLLDTEERAMLRRLAVFAGGCTLAAAETVCAGSGIARERVLDLLAQLVDKSLVLLEGDGDAARYRLLEVVRQYAADQLDTADETAAIRQRHAGHYLALSEEAKRALGGAAQGAWLERLEREVANLRAALDWSRSEGAIEHGLRISANLWRFWYIRGRITEGMGWLQTFLAADDRATPTDSRLNALFAAGRLAIFRGDYRRAQAFLEEMLTGARASEQPLSIAFALTLLGHIALEERAYVQAHALYTEATAHARTSGDRYAFALAINSTAVATIMLGDVAGAHAILIEGIPLYQQLEDTSEVSRFQRWLGVIALEQGDIARARTIFTESLTTHHALQSLVGIAESLESFAALAIDEGKFMHGLSVAAAAAAIRTTISAPQPPYWCDWLSHRFGAAREILGPATSAAVWMHGTTIPMENAIAEVLIVSPALSEPEPPTPTDPDRRDLKQWYGGLTRREREVIACLIGDRTNREVADLLFIAEKTVENHIGSALRKLGFGSRVQLAAWAVAVGLATPQHIRGATDAFHADTV